MGDAVSIRKSRRHKSSKRRFECSFDKDMTNSKRVLASRVEEAAEKFMRDHVCDEMSPNSEKISAIADVYVRDHCLWWIVVDASHVLDVAVIRVKLL